MFKVIKQTSFSLLLLKLVFQHFTYLKTRDSIQFRYKQEFSRRFCLVIQIFPKFILLKPNLNIYNAYVV